MCPQVLVLNDNGWWSLPSGHYESEKDTDATEAIAREVLEELGLSISPRSISLDLILSRKSESNKGRMDFVFNESFLPYALRKYMEQAFARKRLLLALRPNREIWKPYVSNFLRLMVSKRKLELIRIPKFLSKSEAYIKGEINGIMIGDLQRMQVYDEVYRFFEIRRKNILETFFNRQLIDSYVGDDEF